MTASPEASSTTALEWTATGSLRTVVTEQASASTAPHSAAPERNSIITPRLIFYVRFPRPQKIVERTQMRFELASLLLRMLANPWQWNRCGNQLWFSHERSSLAPTKTENASAA